MFPNEVSCEISEDGSECCNPEYITYVENTYLSEKTTSYDDNLPRNKKSQERERFQESHEEHDPVSPMVQEGKRERLKSVEKRDHRGEYISGRAYSFLS